MPDPNLSARLQDALGDAYRIESELPGGGMSRLFLATERSLNRQVVIKVLPPEMASEVSATRFKREMEIAARLQHPHVLPILAAGARGDLLYYVMPYVAGESLRHRLSSHGTPLPVAEAVEIMRDVADALTAAHAAGILHRDIKPENILLESGHAVLTDFGVARAVEHSGPGQLTGTGLAVGTPAYMAPEQIAAEPDVDGRADVYSLALVGYEMLAGRLPFAATPGRASLTAQLTEAPPPLETLRPDAPPAVSAAISRALSKDPHARYDTAREFRDALDSGSATEAAPRASARRRPGRRIAAAAGAGALVAVLAAAWALTHRARHERTLDPNAVAIAPFDVLDPTLRLWREGMVDLLSRNLDGAGPLRTISPTVVVRQWHGRADPLAARELGERTSARYAVFGSLLGAGGDSVRASFSLLDVGSGRVIADIQRADLRERMDRLTDTLTVALIRELGRVRTLGPLRLSSVGTRSLPALKAFLQGQQFLRASAFDSAAASYQQALGFDSTFALAYRGLGLALGWENSDQPRVTASRVNAARFNHGLAPRDSILIAADSLWLALSRGGAGQIGVDSRLFTMLDEATRRYPDDPEVWYELGDARFHFAGGSAVPTTAAQVLADFDRAIAADSAYTPAYIHAVQLGFYLGGADLGRRYAAAYLAQRPTDQSADGIRLAYALSGPDSASANTRKLVEDASADALYWSVRSLAQWPDPGEAAVRLARLMPGRRAQVAMYGDSIFQRALLAEVLAERGHVIEAFRQWRDMPDVPWIGMAGALPADTVSAVTRAWLAAAPRSANAAGCPPCALVWMAFQRDTATLLALEPVIRRLAAPPHPVIPATLATWAMAWDRSLRTLARGDTAAAVRALTVLPDSLCANCGFASRPLRGALLARLGQNRAARSFVDQWSGDPRFGFVLGELERARVAEALGDSAGARMSYERVEASWARADQALQPLVREAADGVARLSPDARKRRPMTSGAR